MGFFNWLFGRVAVTCPMCLGQVDTARGICMRCMASVETGGARVHVSGEDAAEVETLLRSSLRAVLGQPLEPLTSVQSSGHRVFLSYRRSDTGPVVGRMYDRLRAHFGEDGVFVDIDTIPLGWDFRDVVKLAVQNCSALIAVIGSLWLEECEGLRRIDEKDDFVRTEIELGLERRIPVVPVLIGHTPMPKPEELPPSIRSLAYRHAYRIDPTKDFHPHMNQLITEIDRAMGQFVGSPGSNSPDADALYGPSCQAPVPSPQPDSAQK